MPHPGGELPGAHQEPLQRAGNNRGTEEAQRAKATGGAKRYSSSAQYINSKQQKHRVERVIYLAESSSLERSLDPRAAMIPGNGSRREGATASIPED